MERIVHGNNKDLMKLQEEQKDGDKTGNFEKLQASLYTKFNNSSLNKLRVPTQNSQNAASSSFQGAKVVDFNESKHDYLESTVDASSYKNPLRNIHSTMNADYSGRILTDPDYQYKQTKSVTHLSKRLKRPQGSSGNQTGFKYDFDVEKWKLMSKDKYGRNKQMSNSKKAFSKRFETEEDHSDTPLDPDEEKKYTQKLNRNIKPKRPATAAVSGKLTSLQKNTGYIDIDEFFNHRVDLKIETADSFVDKKPNDFSQ